MRITVGKSKPQFKLNIKPKAPLSPFHQLLREAIEVSEKLNTLYGGRLSGPACLREAMALAKCSTKQLDELRAVLQDGTPGLDSSRASVARIKRELLYTRRLNTIPSDAGQLVSRLRYYCRGAPEELSGYKASVLTLLCVAIAEASEENPKLFGTVDSSADLNQNVVELQARQKELFARIATSIPTDELDFGEYLQGRATPARFKNTNVEVAPATSAGQRLVAYLMSQRAKKS